MSRVRRNYADDMFLGMKCQDGSVVMPAKSALLLRMIVRAEQHVRVSSVGGSLGIGKSKVGRRPAIHADD